MADPASFASIFDTLQSIGLRSTFDVPLDDFDLPRNIWWLPYLVILALGAAAAIDAVKGLIPDWIIFWGLFIVTATLGFVADWDTSAYHLRLAVAVGIGLWFVNQLWRKKFRRDAIGMGDAKWTMLAVDCFGFYPAVFAWVAGACLALIWLLGARLTRRKIRHVHFGPFLFTGLLMGIYWLRFR